MTTASRGRRGSADQQDEDLKTVHDAAGEKNPSHSLIKPCQRKFELKRQKIRPRNHPELSLMKEEDLRVEPSTVAQFQSLIVVCRFSKQQLKLQMNLRKLSIS